MKLKEQFHSLGILISNYKTLLGFAWEMDRGLITKYYLTATIGGLAPVAAGVTLKYLIDNLQISSTQPLTSSIPLVIIFVLAARYVAVLIDDIVRYGLNEVYYDYLLRYKLQNRFSLMLIDKISQLDIPHLEDAEVQNLLSKARDTVAWRPPDALRMFRYFFESLIGYIGAFIVLIPFGVWIPVVITVISLPRMFLRIKYGTLEWSAFGSQAPEARKRWYLTFLLTDHATIREMRIFQTQKKLIQMFDEIQTKLLKAHKEPLDRYLKLLVFPSFLESIILFGIAAFLLPDVLSAVITIGSFTLIINMIDRLNTTANGIVGNFASVYEHNLYIQHFIDVLRLPKLIKDKKDCVRLDFTKPPKIEFRNVSFKYTDRYVLRNVSFIVQPGESIALVGPNGAGKSTIIKLLCRFYDVDEGEILINDVNLKDIALENWYSFLGTLFQDFVQYHFTVKENIQLSSDTQNEELIKKAAKQAGIDEYIEKLPEKYDQRLGREFEGEELSGGQWQKLAIARAFYESAPVLILDEPTSAIDAESEFEIFSNLEKHYTNKTLIFVSHRFSTVRNAHKIFVIDEGKVIEEGSHEQLMKNNKRYSKMFKIQAKGYEV